MSKEIYVKQLRLIKPEAKIILFVTKLDETYKGFLFANDVFNIIETERATFTSIIEMIEAKGKQVVYKNAPIYNYDMDFEQDNFNVITRKTICVFGATGAGKSYISSLIAHIISKKMKLNTLLMDMDIQNSSLDLYNNISMASGLNSLMEEIDNDNFDANIFSSNISKAHRNTKLSYLTNNVSLFDLQNKLSNKYYEKIYNEASNKYDVCVVDLPSAPFFDAVPYFLNKSDEIFFVLNPNFISVRQSIKLIDLIINVWGISKNKIHIVLNKVSSNSLGGNQVSSMLNNQEIQAQIQFDSNIEAIINGLSDFSIDDCTSSLEITRIFDDIFNNGKSTIKPKSKWNNQMLNKLFRQVANSADITKEDKVVN